MNGESTDPDASLDDSSDQPSPEQAALDVDADIRLSIPVTIILEQRLISRSFWSVPSWYLHTVAVGQNLAIAEGSAGVRGESGVAAGKTDKGELFAWSGFEVKLYKDSCERYWHALIGDNPLVYVICSDEADDGGTQQLQPVSVSIDYDDASAAAETDVPVLSAPIPGELYKYMERFVLNHYKPQEFKKRKRRNWSAKQPDRTPSGASTRAAADDEQLKEGQAGE